MMPSLLIQRVINGILESKRRNITRGIRATESRANDFPHPLAATLTGIALEHTSREQAEEILDTAWAEEKPLPSQTPTQEVIIGSGYHAAVYATTRVLAGYPAPIILERNSRAGGIFADSHHPSFYLNSRNRPGIIAPAGEQDGSLNYIPGAPIQPANISNSEYQTNADMALAIRFALAQYATVYTNTTVTKYRGNGILEIERGGQQSLIPAARIIDARGLGDPITMGDGKMIFTFPDFMHRMTSTPWPLKGMRRVAVIGGGDSGKCAVEALLGIGPNPPMGSAALDRVERIDWYNTIADDDCISWRRSERVRYHAIGGSLRKDGNGSRRLRIIGEKVTPISFPGGVLIDGRVYDMAIVAIGYKVGDIEGISGISGMVSTTVYSGDVSIARQFRNINDFMIYRVGPRANIPFSDQETGLGLNRIPSNKSAMFRLGPKTLALAATLPTPEPVTVPEQKPVLSYLRSDA